jgi:hypothetical protein
MKHQCCRRGAGLGGRIPDGKPIFFRRLDQRIEFEFGVADRLMTAFYLAP